MVSDRPFIFVPEAAIGGVWHCTKFHPAFSNTRFASELKLVINFSIRRTDQIYLNTSVVLTISSLIILPLRYRGTLPAFSMMLPVPIMALIPFQSNYMGGEFKIKRGKDTER